MDLGRLWQAGGMGVLGIVCLSSFRPLHFAHCGIIDTTVGGYSRSLWNPPHRLLYGWRYDPREFAAAPTERDERARGATRATE